MNATRPQMPQQILLVLWTVEWHAPLKPNEICPPCLLSHDNTSQLAIPHDGLASQSEVLFMLARMRYRCRLHRDRAGAVARGAVRSTKYADTLFCRRATMPNARVWLVSPTTCAAASKGWVGLEM